MIDDDDDLPVLTQILRTGTGTGRASSTPSPGSLATEGHAWSDEDRMTDPLVIGNEPDPLPHPLPPLQPYLQSLDGDALDPRSGVAHRPGLAPGADGSASIGGTPSTGEAAAVETSMAATAALMADGEPGPDGSARTGHDPVASPTPGDRDAASTSTAFDASPVDAVLVHPVFETPVSIEPDPVRSAPAIEDRAANDSTVAEPATVDEASADHGTRSPLASSTSPAPVDPKSEATPPLAPMSSISPVPQSGPTPPAALTEIDFAALATQVHETVLGDLLSRIDTEFDARIAQAMHAEIETALASLQASLRERMTEAMNDVVARAVHDEMTRFAIVLGESPPA